MREKALTLHAADCWRARAFSRKLFLFLINGNSYGGQSNYNGQRQSPCTMYFTYIIMKLIHYKQG